MNDKEILRSLGRAISKRRKLLGLTEQELAAMVDVSEQQIRCIEDGAHNPTVIVLTKIASALQIRVSTLFSSR